MSSPCAQARVVLFFDANMPVVDGCQECSAPNVHLVTKPKVLPRLNGTSVLFNRATDLEIVEWCLSVIRDQYTDAQGKVMPKRYVLATKDQTFLSSARIQKKRRGQRGEVSPFDPFAMAVLTGSEGKVCSVQVPSLVVLDVFTLSSCASGRKYEIQTARSYAWGLGCPS